MARPVTSVNAVKYRQSSPTRDLVVKTLESELTVSLLGFFFTIACFDQGAFSRLTRIGYTVWVCWYIWAGSIMSCSIFIAFGKSTAVSLLSPLERQRPISCQARRSLTASSLFEVTRTTSCTLGARSNAPANVAMLRRKSWPNALDEKPG